MKKFLIGLVATLALITSFITLADISAPEAQDVAKGRGQMARAGDSVSAWCNKVGGDAVVLMQLRQNGLTAEDFAAQAKKYYKSRPDIQRYLAKLGTIVFSMQGLDPVDAGLAARTACEKEKWPEVKPGDQV